MAKRKTARNSVRESSNNSIPEHKEFLTLCEALRPEICVPGFWDALQQNCNQWKDEVTVSPFWKAVRERQPAWSNDFQRATSGALLATPILPDFFSKKVNRAREKLAHHWQQNGKTTDITTFFPQTGPPVPLLNDLIRTRVECQFLDGVESFATYLANLASELGTKFSRVRQGRLQGYFAQHFYFEHRVFFRFGGSEEPTTISCEVQIATALATRVWEESHKVYEEWRIQSDSADDWQWDPNDPRFTARQLGHMIHLADGLLVQLRNSARS